MENLDLYFESKKKSEKTILFALPPLLIIFISYMYLFPLSEDALKKSRTQKRNVKTDLNIQKRYLASLNIHDIEKIDKQKSKIDITNRYKKEIFAIKKEIQDISDEKNYIKTKLIELTNNQESWSDFLNFVAKDAKEKNIKINYIDNKKFNNILSGDIFKDLNIKVDGVGSFRNILKYINSIENFGVFVELNNTTIDFKEDKLHFNLEINNYRVKI